MRRFVRAMLPLSVLVLLALVMPPETSTAQQPVQPPGTALPRDVRREVVARYNGPNEFRSVGRTEIGESQNVRGNVAVLGGPLYVAGRITGNVVVVNGDVVLRPTARIQGDLLVVGGAVDGRSSSQIEGTTRIYRSTLAYREDADKIVALDDEQRGADENWWRKLERQRQEGGNWTEALRIVQAGPYNRTEGLPIQLGPSLERRTPWGSLAFDAAAVVRTASTFASDKGDVGHKLRAEARFGHERGIGVGGRMFNVVDPVERWQLSDLETALAAFVVRRDYRDYYERHGADAYVTLFGARNLSLTGSYGHERWTSRAARNPFTVFNGEQSWRPNPEVADGTLHIADLALKFDSRTDPDDPWSGWYADADLERGINLYTRAFLDLRRYNRLGPSSQLNLRLVTGGWVGGSSLPVERALSVDGPGAMPGYGFRAARQATDVGTCNSFTGAPAIAAECDRIALVQAEYRGDLKVDFLGDWQDWPRRYRSAHGDATWVVFMDAGRGWKLDQSNVSIPGLTYSTSVIPPLSTFRSDIGVGLDIAGIGIYAAKSTSAPSEPLNFFVRLRHRF